MESFLARAKRRLGSLGRKTPIETVMCVQGSVTEEEAGELMRLASEVPPETCIVEVGSHRGRSTAALALGANDAPVYAIEPHEVFEGMYGSTFGPEDRRAFFENMLRVGVVEDVRLVNLSSEVVSKGWTRPIGLLWIDGDHTLEAVRRDFEAWEPFLKPGGVVAFHDALDPAGGPAQVIEDLEADSFEHVATAGRLIALRRGAKSTARSGPRP
jgi:predicted O-methyltransferase YrrM